MFGLAMLLFFISIIALIVGLIKPRLVLRWEKDEHKWTRKNVLKYFVTATIVSFILMMVFVDSDEPVEEPKETEMVEEEPEFAELTAEEKDLFNTPIDELEKLSYDQLDSMVQIINNKDEYTNEDIELINQNKDSINEEFEIKLVEKEEQKAKEEEERKKKEEEEQKAKEEEERKKKEEEAKAEAEKYETGITYQDMARDKDGLVGEYVKFSGKIIQVMQGDGFNQYRMAVNDNYDQVIFIEISDDQLESNILEDDFITIKGISFGNIEYETVLGAKQTVPGVIVDSFTMN